MLETLIAQRGWLAALCTRALSTVAKESGSSNYTTTAIPRPLDRFQCYISRCTDPYINLAFEDWLLRNTDPASYVLYLWRNRPCVVVGRNQNPWKECNLQLMKKRDVWLVRRTSGGGAVYHDMGNSNYSVFMPREQFTRDRCAVMVARALVHLDIPAYVNARHDVTVEDFKVSGSAFKLTRERAFHHGTMLIDVDLGRLKGCLHSEMGNNMVAKGVASVPSPVSNLRNYSWTIDHTSFCNAVIAEFAKEFGLVRPLSSVVEWDESSSNIIENIAEMRDKIKTWDWLYGQTPEFTYNLAHDFGWAKMNVRLTSRHGEITCVTVEDADDRAGASLSLSSQLAQLLIGQPYSAETIESVAATLPNTELKQ
ncbi:hypothetical protein EV182_002894, partial [Spiromyces aspiralis]